MQLRDDIPGIYYPGCWAFFGGHLDPGETPSEAIKRELHEEIRYTLPVEPLEFRRYCEAAVIRYVFHAHLTVALDRLILCEGWDMALLAPDDIERGDFYSPRARQVRPLGSAHQKILLDFLASGLLPTR